ncbi:MAG: sugar transporter [Alphaproteobacteria bacterium HGW-Alphaproteobacteria-13]|nr:MAG: sugar transporter [Alphaproteobacteria bacterium HGW-Alphaproteobacteria-13]
MTGTATQARAAAPSEKLPFRIKLSHGFGAATMGVKEAGLTTFFMIYYNQVLGFDPRLVSLVLIGAMLIDALVDPLIGRLSDATRTRIGRRLPWLYGAALPMAIAWALLWASPDVIARSTPGLVLSVVAVRILVSACEIPSVSLVAELTRDYDERTTLMRYRFLFGWLGGLSATALAYGYFLKSDDPAKIGLLDPAGYAAFGLFGAALIFVSTLGSAAGQHRRILSLPPPPARAHGPSMLAEIALAFRNPAFVALASGALFVVTGYATMIASTNYVMLYVWRLTDAQLAWYPASLAVAVFGAFAAVGRAHRRLGKRDTAVAAALFTGAVAFLPYAARNLGWWPELGGWPSMALLFAFLTISLFGLVIAHISCSSMVAEIVEAHEIDHGTRIEGVFFAGYLMIVKFGQALGIFIVGQLVAFAGLGERIRPEDWPAGTAAMMAWIFAVLMILILIMAAVGLRRYTIDRASHEARLAALAQSNGKAREP